MKNFAVENFPVSGDVNALFIFVQHKDDTFEDCRQFKGFSNTQIPDTSAFDFFPYSYCENTSNRPVFENSICVDGNSWPRRVDDNSINGWQSWTDDPVTEWPHNLPAGPDTLNTRVLPCWAHEIIDLPGSNIVTYGTVTDFYNRVSNGKLNLRGHVWPYTYIPNSDSKFYEDYEGDLPNGMVYLSKEIINYVDDNPFGLDFTSEIWDLYTNGDGHNSSKDGLFDMIILMFRNSYYARIANAGGNSVTSLGSGLSYRDGQDGFFESLTLGDFQVIDNVEGGSGVIVSAYDKRHAKRMIAHELGHRHFGLFHTNNLDHYSIMNGSPHLSFSAPDRIRLGWANIKYLDINDLSEDGFGVFSLWDAHRVNGVEDFDVLWIKKGININNGDLVIEARNRTGSTEIIPDLIQADGDLNDYYLPNEGLYVYKGRESLESRIYTSLLNGGLNFKRKYFGVTESDHQGFSEGDIYSPFTIAKYNFDIQLPLDSMIAITDIGEAYKNSYSFKVWYDYLKEPGNKDLSSYYTFEDHSIARTDTWYLQGRFRLKGPANIDTFTLSGSGTWEGLEILHKDIHLYNGNILNVDNSTAISISYNGFPKSRIEGSVIQNLKKEGVGIHIYGSNTDVFIKDNEITTFNGSTIYSTGSSYASIHGNTLNVEPDPAPGWGSLPVANVHANNGVAAFWQAAYIFDGQNRILGGDSALHAEGNSGTIYAGTHTTWYQNHFCDEDVTVKASSNGTVYASYNYWEDTAPTIVESTGGTVNYGNHLGSPDCGGLLLLSGPNMPSEIVQSSHSTPAPVPASVSEGIGNAHYLSSRGRYHEAYAQLMQVIETRTMPESRIALQELLHLSRHLDASQIIGVFQHLANTVPELRETALTALSVFHARRGDYGSAISVHSMLDMIDREPEQEFAHRLQKFYILVEAEMQQESFGLLASMEPSNPVQASELDVAWGVYGSRFDPSGENRQMNRANTGSYPTTEGKITHLINYPNPFNPVTTISYNLTHHGTVEIRVYDVLGRLVGIPLKKSPQTSGVHHVPFDAARLSSGLYIYRISLNGKPVQTRTMLLIK